MKLSFEYFEINENAILLFDDSINIFASLFNLLNSFLKESPILSFTFISPGVVLSVSLY